MKIDKGIPIPPKGSSGRQSTLVPFLASLEIGDSFLSDGKHKPGSIIATAKYLGIKLTQRKTLEGMRFWRIRDPKSSPKNPNQ